MTYQPGTWIVAVIGIALFLLIAGAMIILRNPANPVRFMKIHPPFFDRTTFFTKVREQPLKNDILFFLAITVLGGFILTIAAAASSINSGPLAIPEPRVIPLFIVGFIVPSIINGFFLLLVISLIEHFFVLFVIDTHPDKDRRFEKTMKTVIYASVLPIIFLWVPAVFHVAYSGLILLGSFLVLTFLGIIGFHAVTKDRAGFVTIFTGGVIVLLLMAGRVNFLGTLS